MTSIGRVASAALMAACVSGFPAGCAEPNEDVKTDLAKISLPKGVSDQPVQKPFKSRAKSSSPPSTRSRRRPSEPGVPPHRLTMVSLP